MRKIWINVKKEKVMNDQLTCTLNELKSQQPKSEDDRYSIEERSTSLYKIIERIQGQQRWEW